MESVYTLIFLCVLALPVLVGIGIGWWFFFGRHTTAANQLQAKFQSLGDMRGKTYDQIVYVVGLPKTTIGGGEDSVTYIWSVAKYQIALRFKSGVCEGVVSEIATR